MTVGVSSYQKTVITAQKTSKAARIINELVKDFPIALPRLVGDVYLWSSRCKNYLNYTKEVLNNPQTLFCLFAKEPSYAKKHNKQELDGSLQNFVRTCSWMFYINRKLLSKNIQFITTSKDLINSGISLTQFMQISYFNASYGKKSKGLNQLYQHAKYFDVVTTNNQTICKSILMHNSKLIKKPTTNLQNNQSSISPINPRMIIAQFY